jgi:hypothetical protein
MLRWLCLATLLAFAVTVTGCSSSSTEIPATKESSQKTAAPQDSAAKAMKSMPPEMQKKMEAQMKKMAK